MARNGNRNGHHLRLTDITDREVLGLVEDNANEDGWTPSVSIASALWPGLMANGNNGDRRSAIQAVGTRLSWMRRIGVIERFEPGRGETAPSYALWALTEEGDGLLKGRLAAPAQRAIDALDGTTAVLAVHTLTDRKRDELVSTLMRRAWAYGTTVRR